MHQIIDLARHLLDSQINHLRSVQSITEAALDRHVTVVDDWYVERRMVVDEDEIIEDREYLDELFELQQVEATEIYPQLARASLFATGYGILEHFMVSLCKHSGHYLKGPALNDLRGDGIVRARLYLTKVAALDFPDTLEWQDLTTYGALRNALVHAQGDLVNSAKAPGIIQLATRLNTFQVVPDRTRVVLLRDFNDQFLTTVEKFGGQLDAAWRDFSN